MVWLEGLEESIGTELGLIVTTPEYNARAEQEFYDYHNWFWRKLQRLRPMRFRFNAPPKYPDKGKTGAIIIPENWMEWGTLIGINYQGGDTFDHPNANETGLGAYGLIPRDISMATSPIIRVKGDLLLDEAEEDVRKVNVYTTVDSTRVANLHYVLRDLDKFLKEPE